ncbi:Uncharacterized protein ChrSV_3830 [Chromobacterium vaccinii]|uniref:Potassium ABC transporter ATPase n=2 Tax=Chromobacteriaceae TaxID=1499392 RepID=A0A1D9LM16_9NEIS|nr:potassium ABC transporter ATPase [Chromobacterium vaccinii]ERE12234.1 hypothetical protein O166_04675 [Pseudogulbenkiania ferrooxidans EGD-HP2]AVG16590.1 potassium ABC transporter ATPase [Chromobacterium vaccinii]QND86056.1 Uncharacterized protein ChrSW_3830 [Chromobacterium vaccinii]QND91287.1 Uncharacterized protein ChrSV_3830 [Chromobacterium vaccinii]
MDLLYLGLIALFGALTWLLIAACDRLGGKQ